MGTMLAIFMSILIVCIVKSKKALKGAKTEVENDNPTSNQISNRKSVNEPLLNTDIPSRLKEVKPFSTR